MKNNFQEIICKATGASELFEIEVIQSLWSGYGKIIRYELKESERKSVVVKHVKLPDQKNHPRGWNTDISHQRKIKSYQVETAWYKQWSQSCDDYCRIPHCLALESEGDEVLIVLEDLNESGYPKRKNTVSMLQLQACLSWLANFHATFFGKKATGLWEIGTYWHLDTRPDELRVLKDSNLKNAATKIDQKLQQSPYQTFVHGDAKLANFCFSQNGKAVAAVDFQYVGGGCGIKDVAYFIGSCLYEDECERLETELLNYYFSQLTIALSRKKITVDPQAVEHNWRALYPLAWTDFHRFIKGWSPGHWKIHSYSERIAAEVIAHLSA
jgi:Ecdysteroid kinase-like family